MQDNLFKKDLSEDFKKDLKEELKTLETPTTADEVRKAYIRVYHRRYRAKNRERIREYDREYRRKNKERIKKRELSQFEDLTDYINKESARG